MTDERAGRGIPFRAMVPNAITLLALCFGLTGVSFALPRLASDESDLTRGTRSIG